MKLSAKTSVVLCILFLLDLCFSYIRHEWQSQNALQHMPVPSDLHPIVKQNADALKAAAANQGITVVMTEGFRSFKEQDELYKQGRTKKGNIVTYARGGESYHNYGLAIDFALQKKDGSIIWDMEYDGNQNGKSDWLEVVEIAKKLGFEWGGDWKRFKDYPHLEMVPG